MTATLTPTTERTQRCGESQRLELTLTCHAKHAGCQPIQAGIPFPRGVLADPARLALYGSHDRAVPFQSSVLARWADGSVKWLLAEWAAGCVPAGQSRWLLRLEEAKSFAPGLTLEQTPA